MSDIQIYKLESVQEKINKVKELDQSWADEEGIALPDETAIKQTCNFVKNLADYEIYPDRVNPSAEGGICLSFHNGTQILHFEIYNDGELGYIIEDRYKKEILENQEIKYLSTMIERIKEFYNF